MRNLNYADRLIRRHPEKYVGVIFSRRAIRPDCHVEPTITQTGSDPVYAVYLECVDGTQLWVADYAVFYEARDEVKRLQEYYNYWRCESEDLVDDLDHVGALKKEINYLRRSIRASIATYRIHNNKGELAAAYALWRERRDVQDNLRAHRVSIIQDYR